MLRHPVFGLFKIAEKIQNVYYIWAPDNFLYFCQVIRQPPTAQRKWSICVQPLLIATLSNPGGFPVNILHALQSFHLLSVMQQPQLQTTFQVCPNQNVIHNMTSQLLYLTLWPRKKSTLSTCVVILRKLWTCTPRSLNIWMLCLLLYTMLLHLTSQHVMSHTSLH